MNVYVMKELFNQKIHTKKRKLSKLLNSKSKKVFWKGVVNGVIKVVLNLLHKATVSIVMETKDGMANHSHFKVI